MRSPPYFHRRSRFFTETLDRPGADEFVHFFRPVRDLRVAFAYMDRFHAKLHGQAVEFFIPDQAFQDFPVCPGESLVTRCFFGNIKKPLFCEMGNKPGIGAVVQHGGRGIMGPIRRHLAEFHLFEIKRFLKRRFFVDIGVRVPFLDRGIHVENLILMTPGEHIKRVDIPRKIDDHASGRNVFGKRSRDIDGAELFLRVADAFFDPRREFLALVGEIEDRNILVRNTDMLEKDR